jgi:uncharacterized membrane protein
LPPNPRVTQKPLSSPPPNDSAIPRIALGALGAVLFAAAPRRRPGGTLLRLAGLAMIGVAAAPTIDRGIRRAGVRRRNVAFHEAIEIDRPVADVFAFFKDFENFPKVIGALRSVTDYQDGRSHWAAYSPAGHIIEWDAVVTKYMPNNVIGWESVTRSVVESVGVARFSAVSASRTRLDLNLTYHPAQTTLGDAVRALVSPSFIASLRRDLEHVRFYLESLPPRVVEEPAPTKEAEPLPILSE